ncbi:hypothetical protein ABZ924_19610 [Streptomyces sp. NPDC046876]|uniref:hypothetical protein n=1 Tax=Streptomyces sp. NPDC046876 TaxID=3155616 RepID=UPI0033E25CAD
MHARTRPRLLIAAAALSAALVACSARPQAPAAPSAPAGSPAAAAAAPSPVGAVASAATTPSAAAEATAPASPHAAASAAPREAAAPLPTRTTLAVTAAGGRLELVRGGAAREFTVTLRGGSAQAYRHLLVAFQMEPLPGGPAESFLLERRDPVSGAWRPAALRIAGDAKPAHLYEGGTPLAAGALRTERYRLRATAEGVVGSSPLMVYAVDTDAVEGSPADVTRAASASLPVAAARAGATGG